MKQGDLVKILPHCDLFMRGVTVGQIVTIGKKWVTITAAGIVAHGRKFKLALDCVEPI